MGPLVASAYGPVQAVLLLDTETRNWTCIAQRVEITVC